MAFLGSAGLDSVSRDSFCGEDRPVPSAPHDNDAQREAQTEEQRRRLFPGSYITVDTEIVRPLGVGSNYVNALSI